MGAAPRLAALVALVALAACRGGDHGGPSPSASTSVPPPPAPPPPTAEELALLAPVAVGKELADGFEVRAIHGVQDGVVRVICGKERATVRLSVALLDPEGPVPPASAGKYAVYYSLKNAFPEEGERLAKKLAKALEAHGEASPPAGMTRFVAQPKPSMAL